MNSYLLNRTLGSISPHTFHVAQTSRLVHHLEPAPGIRFSSRQNPGQPTSAVDVHLNSEDELYAHRAGVNVLAIDQYDGRLYVPELLSSTTVLNTPVWSPGAQTPQFTSGI